MKSLKERWKKAITDPAWWATIFILISMATIIVRFKI
jgi:hypothetical protein